MGAILHERLHIAQVVNATVIGIEDAPRSYAGFDRSHACVVLFPAR
ncbi:hypothetical protein [Streptomyces sp. NPDC057623]